jgi:hypothetical protein
MVKFGKYLLEACVPEWQPQYINYRQLKKALKRILNSLSNPSSKGRVDVQSCEGISIRPTKVVPCDDVKIVQGRFGQSRIVRLSVDESNPVPLPTNLPDILPPVRLAHRVSSPISSLLRLGLHRILSLGKKSWPFSAFCNLK